MSFADEVDDMIEDGGWVPETAQYTVDELSGGRLKVQFVNRADPVGRHTALYLSPGCDLSKLAEAVAVQVYAVTG